MFGSQRTTNALETLSVELQLIKDELNALKVMNEEAIVNKKTITKFLDDMHQIFKITTVEEARKENVVKKKGRPRKIKPKT